MSTNDDLSTMTLEEHMALNPHPSPLAPVPLIYDDTASTTSIQKVLFVNSGAVPLETHANATTFPIVYDSSSALEDILEVMRRKFPDGLSRIGFAFHNHGDLTSFVNREAWFSDSDLDNNQTVFSPNAQFMMDFLREFKVTHVDFLACKTLQSEKWRKYYQLVQSQTGVIVGASDDDTGNVKYGGDWVMESTMEDIRDVYFTTAVENYASLLLSTYTTVINLSANGFTMPVDIVGDTMYTAGGEVVFKVNLLNNTKTTLYTNTTGSLWGFISSLCVVGNYLYVGDGAKIVRIDLITGTSSVFYSQSGVIPYSVGSPDGIYLYITNRKASGSIIRVNLSEPTPTFVVWTTGLNYPEQITFYGGYVYTVNTYRGDGSTDLIRASYATINNGVVENVMSTYGLSTASRFGGVFQYNSFLYLNDNGKASGPFIAANLKQINLSNNVVVTPYFQAPGSGIAIYQMAVYKNRLYVAAGTLSIIAIDLPPVPTVAPSISSRPTATAITYPATLATVSLTGGAALSAIGGTSVAGTFTINNPTTVLNAGTYTDISATFLPTDTTAYSVVSTSIPSITVLKGTPYLAARPTSATVIYPNKLGAMTITGGSCTVSNGGATIPGTFTIHPDLSNSVFAVGTYQDVSAVFIPTASINYNQINTTIPTFTVTQPSTAQLASIGVSATDLKTAGFNATELKTAGFTVTQQKAAGYSAAQMKNAGYDVSALYQVFTTTTEKKSVTKAVVSDILTAASTPKTTVALSTLVGYTFNPLVTSVVAVKVTDVNTPITVSRSELQSGAAAVYAVLDVSSSYIVIPTWYSSLRVMNIGNDKYRIYNSNGTTILYDNLLLGDTRTHDGLTVVIGSVTATFTPPPPVNFVLTALNSQFQLSTSGAIPIYTPTLTSDAVITLNTTVTAEVMQNTFFYRTDKDVTQDASFVYYYVDSTKWTNQSTVLNPKNGVVTTNMYVSDDGVGKDFLRDLAKQLFGTYLGADLFTNEDSVVTDIHAKCDSVATYAVALINSIDKTVGTSTLLKTDLSGGKYLDDNVTTSNISRELFNQLMTSAPGRFNDTKPQKYNTVEDGFYKLPILQGDTITFKMTISPSTTQTAAVPTGPTSLQSRSYKVVLLVG